MIEKFNTSFVNKTASVQKELSNAMHFEFFNVVCDGPDRKAGSWCYFKVYNTRAKQDIDRAAK